jgi:hypothetical protein
MPLVFYGQLTLQGVTCQAATVGFCDGRSQIRRPVGGKVLMWVMAFGAGKGLGHESTVDAGTDFVRDPAKVVRGLVTDMAG